MNPRHGLDDHDIATLRRAIHHGLHDGSSPVLLHRLHALLLAAQCQSLREAARVGGDSLRSLQRWQRRWCESGVDGLRAAEPHGRTRRLESGPWQRLCEQVAALDAEAASEGRRPIGAAVLAWRLQVEFGQRYSRRQCQRLLRSIRASVAAPGDLSEPGGDSLRGGSGGWLM